ncbi:hypothetical protein ZOSMA_143G00190 [Zostera marina]|uniref:F-box domain-containing protein n=1 Tax=Zostera marina TaxID=29655 RepID=A0A0K9PXH1_ZOSMR|nr:hypothetical protein ZOSMA_143G00190 [Zostera marina]
MNGIQTRQMIKNNVDMPDRLSKLPRDILLLILSSRSLNMKDRAKTCVISKQWKDLWLNVSDIHIDQKVFFEGKDNKSLRNLKIKDFESVIDRVMDSNEIIDTLDITITDAIDGNTTNRWIVRAIQRNVQNITMSVSKDNNTGSFVFPTALLQCPAFKTLTLETIFDLKTLPNCKYLETLNLFRTDFGKQEDYLLPFYGDHLQTINFKDIDSAINLVIVSGSLKKLTIHGAQKLEKFAIATPNITELDFMRRTKDDSEPTDVSPPSLDLDVYHSTFSEWCRFTLFDTNFVRCFNIN